MKSAVQRIAVGVVLAAGLSMPAFAAEETTAAKTLPTLLIKGEVVSVDSSDPAAVLLKVKDRYGFETPIYLTQETKMTQGDTALGAANLATGNAVEVEYNFDINTAKRHAVSVKVSTAPPVAQAPAAPATPAASAASTPAAPEAATPAALAAPAAVPAASPSSSAQPAVSTPPAAPAAQPASAPAPTAPSSTPSTQ